MKCERGCAAVVIAVLVWTAATTTVQARDLTVETRLPVQRTGGDDNLRTGTFQATSTGTNVCSLPPLTPPTWYLNSDGGGYRTPPESSCNPPSGPFRPYVANVNPPAGSEDQSVAANVVVTFSEPVNPLTVTSGSFSLRNTQGVTVTASVSISPSGLQATLDPSAALDPLMVYTVAVTSAADVFGIPFTPFSSTFTTAASNGGGSELPSSADQLLPPPGASNAQNGWDVALAGDLNGDGLDDIVSGAPGYAVTSEPEAGAAIVYFGSTVATERRSPDIIFTGITAHDRAGVSVAGHFDYNSDGRPDLLIGAEQVNHTATGGPGCAAGAPCGPGLAYLIFFDPSDAAHYPNIGNPTVPDVVSLSLVGQPGGIPGIVFTGDMLGDRVGFSVAAGGRVNPGSGQDLLIGAPGWDPPAGADAGAAFVVFDGLASSAIAVSLGRVANGQGNQIAGVVYRGAAAGDQLGHAVTFLPSVAGTAADDLAIAAPMADTVVLEDEDAHRPARAGGAERREIPATLLDGVALDLPASPGDGSPSTGSDLSSPLRTPGTLDHLSGAAPARAQLERPPVGEDSSAKGRSRDEGPPAVGDSEADDSATVEGTAIRPATTMTDAGIVYVAEGGALTTAIVTASAIGASVDGVQFLGDQDGMQLGYSVASGGDNRVDGQNDLLMGAPYFDETARTDVGAVYQTASSLGRGIVDVCRVGSLEANGLNGVTWTGASIGDRLGLSVTNVGDVTGDGNSDIILGAPYSDPNGVTDTGTTYLIAGTTRAAMREGIASVSTVGITTPGGQFIGTEAGEHVGISASASGNFNGTGTNDFAVGASDRDVAAETDSGTVYAGTLDDSDEDGLRDAVDCRPSDNQVWAVPGDVSDVRLGYDAGAGPTTLQWAAPQPLGGQQASVIYDVLRSPDASNFGSSAFCVASNDSPSRTAIDGAPTPAGTAVFYLIRAENVCGAGSLGTNSQGMPRSGRSCP